MATAPGFYSARDLIDPAVGIGVHRARQAPEVGEHGHDFVEVVLVAAGRAEHRLRWTDGGRGRPRRIAAGDVFAIAPGERHAYHDARGLVLYNLLFLPDAVTEHLERLRILPGLADFLIFEPVFRRATGFDERTRLPAARRRRLSARLDRMGEELAARAPGYDLICRAIFVEFLVLCARAWSDRVDPSGAGPTARAVAFMRAHIDESLDLSTIATSARLSPHYFCEQFKRAAGETPLSCLRRLRVDEARRLLRETDDPVGVVASAVGFQDASHFARVFKAATGESPSSWRSR